LTTKHVRIVDGVSSGVAPIFVEPNGQNRILVVKGANDTLKPADVDAAAEVLRTVDTIVLQFEIPMETIAYTVQFARKNKIRVHRESRAGTACGCEAIGRRGLFHSE